MVSSLLQIKLASLELSIAEAQYREKAWASLDKTETIYSNQQVNKTYSKIFDRQVWTCLHKSKNRIMAKYVMDCAIGMQLHFHGLVKHVIEIRYHNLKTVMLNHKNDIKLFEITPC